MQQPPLLVRAGADSLETAAWGCDSATDGAASPDSVDMSGALPTTGVEMGGAFSDVLASLVASPFLMSVKIISGVCEPDVTVI